MVRVTYKPTDFSVLVRAYGKGSELIIDRKQEVVVSNLPLKDGFKYPFCVTCYDRILLLYLLRICVHRSMLDSEMV